MAKTQRKCIARAITGDRGKRGEYFVDATYSSQCLQILVELIDDSKGPALKYFSGGLLSSTARLGLGLRIKLWPHKATKISLAQQALHFLACAQK